MQALKPVVYVAERRPDLDGHALAAALSSKIEKVVIPDSAVAAVMPRATRVLLGAVAIAHDGSAVVPRGSYALALAAAASHVPVIVLADALRVRCLRRYGRRLRTSQTALLVYYQVLDAPVDTRYPVVGVGASFTCSPWLQVTPIAVASASELQAIARAQRGNPAAVLPLRVAAALPVMVDVLSPTLEVLPPSLIHTFVTNTHIGTPAEVERIAAELYGAACCTAPTATA